MQKQDILLICLYLLLSNWLTEQDVKMKFLVLY